MSEASSSNGEQGRPEATRGALLGPRIAAGVLVIGAVFLIFQALQIRQGAGYSVVGPGTMPLVAAIGLLVLGGVFAVRTTLMPDTELGVTAAAEEQVTHWPTIAVVGGLLILYAVALNGFRLGSFQVPGLGYIVATTVFLPAAAWALGSRAVVRNVVVGVVIAVVVYFGFTEFLGVRLPGGLLDGVLP